MYYGEKFNSISHVVGAALSLVGLGALLTIGGLDSEPRQLFSFGVFGLSLVIMYTMSTLYHSFPILRVKRVFRQLDHASIYVLIAGTYTPFLMVSLWKGDGPVMLGVIWALAIIGMVLDLAITRRVHSLQIAIYLAMGWLSLLIYNDLAAKIAAPGMSWLLWGGVAYSVGVIFYVLDKKQRLTHAHGIWHLFVLIGSISHFISVIGYVR